MCQDITLKAILLSIIFVAFIACVGVVAYATSYYISTPYDERCPDSGEIYVIGYRSRVGGRMHNEGVLVRDTFQPGAFHGSLMMNSYRYRLMWCGNSSEIAVPDGYFSKIKAPLMGAQIGTIDVEHNTCFRCGIEGSITWQDQAIDIPGPAYPGIYHWNVDLVTRSFEYTCVDQCGPDDAHIDVDRQNVSQQAWDVHTIDQVYIYGSAVEDAHAARHAVPLIKDDEGIFVANVTLNLGSFRVIQSRHTPDVGLGLVVGSATVEANGCTKCNLGGMLALDTATISRNANQVRYDMGIPGPVVSGLYTVQVNLGLGTVQYVCARHCNHGSVTMDGILYEGYRASTTVELFVIGNSTDAGWDRVNAVALSKDLGSETIFRGNLNLRPGTFKFTMSRSSSDDTALGIQETSELLVYPDGCQAQTCGIYGILERVPGELQAIPGPLTAGVYSVVANLEAGIVYYQCAERCEGPPTSNMTYGSQANTPAPATESTGDNSPFGQYDALAQLAGSADWSGPVTEQLLMRGRATDAGWSLQNALELTRDNDTNHIFRSIVSLRAGRGGFQFPTTRTRSDVMFGTAIGSWWRQSSGCFKCGVSGMLQNARRDSNGEIVKVDIPGPAVDGIYEVVVNLDTGAFSYKCAQECALPYDPATSGVDWVSDTFVHLFEWSWKDIATECEDWLGPKGYRAVQISPPSEHDIRAQWWSRYQPVSYNLTSRSGDEDDFVDMVQRCKAVGVGVYVDAVINHMATGRTEVGTAGSSYDKYEYPIFSASDFHHFERDGTILDDLNRNCGVEGAEDAFGYQMCGLYGMPDLCTECDHVRAIQSAFFDHLEDIGVEGYRVDAAKHMNVTDLAWLFQNRSGYRVFEMGDSTTIPHLDYVPYGQVTEMRYSRFIKDLFLIPGQMERLLDLNEAMGLSPGQTVVVFINNHDTQRSHPHLTFRHRELFTLATIFMLAQPYGYPKVMSSYYFEESDTDTPPPTLGVHGPSGLLRCGEGQPWVCEHRWPEVANMVQWRKSAQSSSYDFFNAVDGDRVYFCRGSAACLALNRNERDPWIAVLNFTMPGGIYCDVIHSGEGDSDCSGVELYSDGSALVMVPPLGAVAIHTGALANTSSSNDQSLLQAKGPSALASSPALLASKQTKSKKKQAASAQNPQGNRLRAGSQNSQSVPSQEDLSLQMITPSSYPEGSLQTLGMVSNARPPESLLQAYAYANPPEGYAGENQPISVLQESARVSIPKRLRELPDEPSAAKSQESLFDYANSPESFYQASTEVTSPDDFMVPFQQAPEPSSRESLLLTSDYAKSPESLYQASAEMNSPDRFMDPVQQGFEYTRSPESSYEDSAGTTSSGSLMNSFQEDSQARSQESLLQASASANSLGTSYQESTEASFPDSLMEPLPEEFEVNSPESLLQASAEVSSPETLMGSLQDVYVQAGWSIESMRKLAIDVQPGRQESVLQQSLPRPNCVLLKILSQV